MFKGVSYRIYLININSINRTKLWKTMKIKIYKTIEDRIKKIENDSFNEDDIKLFLIEIRDFLNAEFFLREICDFIAHPKRNKGICHKRIDSRYGKLKFLKESSDKMHKDNFFNKHKDKPWNFFSDEMLSYIHTEKIDKQLFEIIIKEGIEEIDDYLFKEHYHIDKNKVKDIINTSYKKEKNDYVLNKNIQGDKKLFIDDLLKFIRGTITGKAAFCHKDIEEQLISSLIHISNKISYKICIKSIKQNLDSVIVCILCVLQEAIFTLFDGSTANSFLSIDRNNNEIIFSLSANASNFSFPIISTNIKVDSYLKEDEKSKLKFENFNYSSLKRNKNNKFELV